jgi:F-type H+-transporting ATPase subunit delta
VSLESVASRYAAALFELGNEQGNLSQLSDEIRRIAEAYSSSHDLRSVLDNPVVLESQRTAILREICERLSLSPSAKNVVGLLAERQRLATLPFIARALAQLTDEHMGVVRASVTSATKLDEGFYGRLQREMEAKTGRKVSLERAVDPTLLGGIVVRVGDRIIDGSLRTRLDGLQAQLVSA